MKIKYHVGIKGTKQADQLATAAAAEIIADKKYVDGYVSQGHEWTSIPTFGLRQRPLLTVMANHACQMSET